MTKKKKAEIMDATAESSSKGRIYSVINKNFAAYAEFFEQNGLEELIIEEKGTKIIFRKNLPLAGGVAPAPIMPVAVAPAPAPAPSAAPAPTAAAPAVDEDAGLEKVVSPLNGTFYSSPSPESAAFVSVGSSVSAGTVLCIVEAMKIFNEIKSELNGKVVKTFVKSGEAVKEGQTLFLIEPT